MKSLQKGKYGEMHDNQYGPIGLRKVLFQVMLYVGCSLKDYI